MIGTRLSIKRGGKDEAEKPFWISFADLMTALMVLFLVVMAVALLAVTKTVTEQEKQEQQYKQDVEEFLRRFMEAAKRHPGIRIDLDRRVVDFGDRAQFASNMHNLSPDQERVLRQFVPEILTLANDDLGKRILKRVVVEGYTDKTGEYLLNLNLSLQRSQRVVCAMFAEVGDNLLSESQKTDVRNLFLVGGYSFNDAKESDEQSRRVEMRLELLSLGEERAVNQASHEGKGFGRCML
jgi:outer membrane protein OmpA-like peptidoglycan-associated protein